MASMGCVSSSPPSPAARSVRRPAAPQPTESILQAYLRLEAATGRMEGSAPAAHLAALLPLLQDLQQELGKYEDSTNRLTSAGDRREVALLEVIADLKIAHDQKLATEHEEFVANINRKVMSALMHTFLEKEFLKLSEKKTQLESEVSNLQMLYKEQEVLLEGVLGAQYGSAAERELEVQLGGARALRDTVAGAAGAWSAAAQRAQRAHQVAEQALLAWQLGPHASSSQERILLGQESLRCALEGVAALHMARVLLPSVPFPHCTARQLQALHLTLEYMFTDMFLPDRYNHATRVFTGFNERSLLLATWITETLKSTLDQDLQEIDRNLDEISSELRTVRANLIAERGLNNVQYKQSDEFRQA